MTIREAAERFLYEDLEEQTENKAAEIRQEQIKILSAMGYSKDAIDTEINTHLQEKVDKWRRHRVEMIQYMLDTYSIKELAEIIGAL